MVVVVVVEVVEVDGRVEIGRDKDDLELLWWWCKPWRKSDNLGWFCDDDGLRRQCAR